MADALADIHCHVLPGIDDGALDLEDAIDMARQAADDGIATVCATPHIRHDHDVRIAELPARVDELRRALAAEDVAVEIVTGGEVAATALAGLTDDELRGASLGGADRWILLEPAPGPLGPSLVEAVDALAVSGRRAVIAHPERHAGPGLEGALAAAVGRGALVQGTAAHLLDPGARELLVELAGRGLLHLLASDAHSSRGGRPVAIRSALELLEPPLREFAASAPAAILRGELLDPPQAAASGHAT
jgi:protein-tyrosine phosphatase